MYKKQIKVYRPIRSGQFTPVRNCSRQIKMARRHFTLKCRSLKEGQRIRLRGKEIYFYKAVDSSNIIARSLAQSGAADGIIIVCETQTAGRGRRGRQWSCPTGKGILMSMVLRPQIAVPAVPLLTLLTGVVVAETIHKATGCTVGIKWPNDIIISGKKVCGILAESSISSQGVPEHVIMGIGINVNLEKSDLPSDCMETSTSLKMELGKPLSRLSILREFIAAWDEHYQAFLQNGNEYIFKKWKENNITLGRTVTISKGSESIIGMAVDISDRGGLVIRLSNGTLEEFMAEDVSLGRSHYQTI